MKPASLSLRIGLWVGLLGSVLMVLLISLTYLVLEHQLDIRARQSLDSKMDQVRHRLDEDMGPGILPQGTHALRDLIIGHDYLSLTLLPTAPGLPPLMQTESFVDWQTLDRLPLQKGSLEWTAGNGHNLLTSRSVVTLENGESVRVFLTLDRHADAALLGAFLRSSLLSTPLLLLLIALGARLAAQRGLLPLRRFGKVAALVSTDDMSHRIPVKRLPDELKDAAHALNTMLGRLDEGVRQLTQFSDDLSHELRSPINNMLGKTQVALSRRRDNAAYQSVLESNVEELERVARIVSEMLFLAQVSHPKILLPSDPVHLGAEAHKVAELFELSAEEKDLQIQITGDAQVFGDRLMIQRAISNLLSNAIRHTPERSIVEVRISEDESGIALQVENPGPGIAAEHLPHLFERFYRVDPSRTRAAGGTGLGLAIVNTIMDLHQGTVSAQSSEAGPTRFLLRFPRRVA
ncbi:heavy metal sensor histidine kinase [Pseudomonas pseudonitroreducens]|jgi:two-component system heavy metal sensor histidine kinase CusS|uniref:heavy metal sensor histidine kinase n=1 Tax=Pseudomonas pseudonitroreducens TaxID=2892326 RepID=UPI001F3C976C|nr:heavy metal sensor histidine kinase [Pseudomonas pseudonitroreducens]